MPTIRVPRPLRTHTGGHAEVVVDGHDVRSVLVALVRRHPGLEDRLWDSGGNLHRFLNVFVGEEDVRHHEGLDTPVAATDTVTLVPAVAGGATGGWETGR